MSINEKIKKDNGVSIKLKHFYESSQAYLKRLENRGLII